MRTQKRHVGCYKSVKQNVMVKLLTFVAVIMLAISPHITASAGFGDFNDYDYGGGSDWDSGDSWDSGNSWDSGSSSSRKYNTGSSYSSSSYSGSDDITAADIPIVIIVVVVIIIFSLSKSKNGNNAAGNGSAGGNSASGSRPPQAGRTISRAPSKIVPNRTEQITEIMKKKDVNFTANDFLSYAKRVYVDIQDAWSKRDLEPVRSVLHPNLYQQTQKQVEKKIADGIVNHLERISVNTAYITGYRQDDDYEYMYVYLVAKMIDYQVKEATGQVIYGDKTTRWEMFYKMTFMRAIDMQTADITEEDDNVMRCPSCGAPVEGTAFGTCQYCGSTVSTGKYGWVLSDFGVFRDDTPDEGIHLKEK